MLWRTGASLDLDSATSVAIGRVVRRVRLERKMTQEQVAWATDMSRVYLSEIERGQRAVSVRVFLRLASALSIAAPTLLAEVEADIEKLLKANSPRPKSPPHV